MICDTPYYVLPKAKTEKVPVPCGRCPNCKLRRVNDWVFRLMQHSKVSDNSHFVTLTYDTRHVPITENGFMTLDKDAVPLFMKRLRKYETAQLKYYAVGEYGTNNKRPHYHMILFGVSDIENIHKAWNYGSVWVGTVTGDSIAYTMKYIDKSRWRPDHWRDDRIPEFPLMSKGLGENYLTHEVVKYHKSDVSRMYATKEGGHKIALPRYYRNKIYSDLEKKQQLVIAQSISDRNEQKMKEEFRQLNYPPGYTYEDYKESMRYGRYKSFYSNQKNRDI